MTSYEGMQLAIPSLTVAPLLWARFTETSGSIVRNYGKLGEAQNGVWTLGAGALGQTGYFGVNHAADFDGLVSKVSIPAIAAINALTKLTYGILFKADTFGELNLGGLILDTGENRQVRFNTNGAVRAILAASGQANSVTANSFVSTGVWTYLFMTYDDSGDRKIRLYKLVSGVLTEASYTTQTAATGTLANGVGDLVMGNAAAQHITFDGLIDDVFVDDRVYTSDEMKNKAA